VRITSFLFPSLYKRSGKKIIESERVKTVQIIYIFAPSKLKSCSVAAGALV
jgi:hypothetical protein